MKKALIITGPGFEDVELMVPYYRFKEEKIAVDIITSTDGEVKSKHGLLISPTLKIRDLKTRDFDLTVVPGGHEAPDRVRQVPDILKFIRRMDSKKKLIASTCHGFWVLISAKIVKGRKANCYKGMVDDLINAGAIYDNKPAVIDGNLITSDHPRNLGLWMRAIIEKVHNI